MINFVSYAVSIAELAHGEKLCTHSPSLFDAREPKLSFWSKFSCKICKNSQILWTFVYFVKVYDYALLLTGTVLIAPDDATGANCDICGCTFISTSKLGLSF